MKIKRLKSTLFDRKGKAVSQKEYDKLLADEHYRYLRRYRNGNTEVAAEWFGRVPDAADCPREYWPLFRVVFRTRLEFDDPEMVLLSGVNGKWVEDPILTVNFPTEAAAIGHYEKVLLTHTSCRAAPDNDGAMRVVADHANGGSVDDPGGRPYLLALGAPPHCSWRHRFAPAPMLPPRFHPSHGDAFWDAIRP